MIIRTVMLALAVAGLGACTTTLLPPNVTPSVPLTHSVEQAQRKLEESRLERAAVEARFSAAEQVCYTKFFVNNCLDAAKEKRREALAYVRAVEVEAEYFVRKAEVEERDRKLAQSAKEFAEAEAKFAAQPPAPDTPPAPPRKLAHAVLPPSNADEADAAATASDSSDPRSAPRTKQ